MGIAFGLSVIFGTRAATGSYSAVLPVIVLLLAAIIITRDSVRQICIVAAVGCVLGIGAGVLAGTEDSIELLIEPPSGLIVGVVRSDVETAAHGGFASHFEWRDSGGTLRDSRIFVPPAPEIGRGDRIELIGDVKDPTGETIYADATRVVEQAGWIEQQRRSIRSFMRSTIQTYVPGSPGALTLGLLIGDDSALTADNRENMRRTGLSHLTAVSGWNVTLVVGTVGLVMLRLGLRGWGWTALQLAALAWFVWIVGLEPPVTRAAIMAVVGIVAIRMGRPAHSVTVLVISAALMVAVSPAALASISYQLSVLATLGLVLAARLTGEFDSWKSVVLTPLTATVVVGLLTSPVLAAEFGTLTLLTVPANVIAAPLVPIASVAGIVVVALSPVAPLAAVAGWVAWLLSGLLLWLARQLAAVPYAFHQFAPLSPTAQATIYAAMLSVAVLVLPEGRLMVRNAVGWAQREPVGAAVTAGTACAALVSAALTV